MKQLAERGVRRLLQSYWRMTRSLTLGAQGVVFDDIGRVLLIRHTYRPGWHFPGGGVEKNEPVMTALRRELHEEAGIEVGADPKLFALYTNFRAFPCDHIVLFVVQDWSQPTKPKPNHEIAEQGFFPPDDLPDGTIQSVVRRLNEIRTGTAIDTCW